MSEKYRNGSTRKALFYTSSNNFLVPFIYDENRDTNVCLLQNRFSLLHSCQVLNNKYTNIGDFSFMEQRSSMYKFVVSVAKNERSSF